ncbi:MAG: hypothetical protein QM541_15185 [Flavobacterium sp.]|nr:hypothetical protein [Flavobacterium sp.]
MSKRKIITKNKVIATQKVAPNVSSSISNGKAIINNKYITIGLILLSCIPIIIIWKMISEYSLNLPYSDDYDAILSFLNNWHSTAGWGNKVALLFSQHNEHRILHSRIIYVIYTLVFGKISFLNLIYINTLELLIIAAVFAYFIYKAIPQKWALAVLVISFCLLSASNWENCNFAMAGMQNFGVVMLFMLSLYFYSKSNKWFNLLLAFLFQFLCAFSSGNGIIGGIALLLFCVFQKQKIKIYIAAISFVVFSVSYFFYYQKAAFTGSHSISEIISYYFYLSGNLFGQNASRPIFAIFLYAILLLCCCYKTNCWKFITSKQVLPFIAIIVFVTLSMAAVALNRSSGGNKDFTLWAYVSRYFIYPSILTTLVFVLLFIRLQKYKYINGFMLLCLFISFALYQPNYDYSKRGFESFYNNLTYKKYCYPDTLRAQSIIIESCKLNIYCIEDNR